MSCSVWALHWEAKLLCSVPLKNILAMHNVIPKRIVMNFPLMNFPWDTPTCVIQIYSWYKCNIDVHICCVQVCKYICVQTVLRMDGCAEEILEENPFGHLTVWDCTSQTKCPSSGLCGSPGGDGCFTDVISHRRSWDPFAELQAKCGCLRG